MDWIKHSNLEGKHAFLSASKSTWTRYITEEGEYDYARLYKVFDNSFAAEHGTRLHALAEELIKLKIRLPKSQKTLNLHVNEAIKYDMTPEVVLYYSDYCFGTADAIAFNSSTNTLRIHDLKTGSGHVDMTQLQIYAALFCLEYGVDPYKINIILKIFQNNDSMELIPEADDIQDLMSKIIECSRALEKRESEMKSLYG